MENEIVMFKNGELELEVSLNENKDTVWLNRHQIAKLFDRDIKTINKHINNAINEELSDDSVVAKYETTEIFIIFSSCCKFCNNLNYY